MKAYPFTCSTASTMRQNCGGSLMFNMYLSGTSSFVCKMSNIGETSEKGRATPGVRARDAAHSSIRNASSLSEIGFPFSCTRFLTSALKSGQIHRACSSCLTSAMRYLLMGDITRLVYYKYTDAEKCFMHLLRFMLLQYFRRHL